MAELDEERYAVRRHDDITIVRIKVVNLSSILEVQRVAADLNGLIDEGTRKLVLDLKYARLFGSAALGMLIELAKKLNLTGGKLVISHPEHILPVLQMTKVGRLFELAPDPKAASKMFNDTL